MTSQPPQSLAANRQRARALRAQGFTYNQIAAVLALDVEASPLRLYRHAHGLTSPQVTDAFNQLDPAGNATLRDTRLREYEAWPRSGRRPPAWSLALLARIYQTHARQLLPEGTYGTYAACEQDIIDQGDHRHLDPCAAPRTQHTRPPDGTMEEAAPAFPGGEPHAEAAPQPAQCTALLSALDAVEPDMKRRTLLFELALALGGVPALPYLRRLTAEEEARLAAAIHPSARIDSASIGAIEQLTAQCWRTEEGANPRDVLPVADGLRNTVAGLLRDKALMPGLRDRVIKAYWNLSHLSGWTRFDLLDHAGAERNYQAGLAAAHELGDPVYLAHTHGLLAIMARYRESPARSLDHAFAAEGWAKASRNPIQQAATSLVLARALAMARQDEHSLRLIDNAGKIAGRHDTGEAPSHLWWITPTRVHGNAIYCLTALGRPDEAIQISDSALNHLDRSCVRRRAELLLDRIDALIQKREIAESAGQLSQVAEVAAQHTSTRLIHGVHQSRRRLNPWAANSNVRQLDDQMRGLGLVVSERL